MKVTTKPAKKRSNTRAPRDERFSMSMKPFGDITGGLQIQFGGVTVLAPKPAKEIVQKQIVSGNKAASRLAKAIARPGIKLRRQAGIPIFRADPRDPALIVRVLDGVTTLGRFVQGKFVITA